AMFIDDCRRNHRKSSEEKEWRKCAGGTAHIAGGNSPIVNSFIVIRDLQLTTLQASEEVRFRISATADVAMKITATGPCRRSPKCGPGTESSVGGPRPPCRV